MTFTSVSRSHLQKAFALAHRLSENPNVPCAQRGQFRAVAYLIWKAHGEQGGPPPGAGERIAAEFARAGDPIADIVPKPPPARGAGSALHAPKCGCGDCVIRRVLAEVAGYGGPQSGELT